MVEMKVQGIFFDSETNQSIVVLKEESSGRTLPIWVGLFEANAITMGIEHGDRTHLDPPPHDP
jgi:uncharacterized protein